MKAEGLILLAGWEKEEEKSYSHTYPDSTAQESYFYYHGMFLENSRVYDLTRYRYLHFRLRCKEENTYRVTAEAALFGDGKPEEFERYTARASRGKDRGI